MSDRRSKQSKADQTYCICRSSHNRRFMIACDACDEWYHGECINISPWEAENMDTYFCERCQEKDPTLKTPFRPQKRDHNEDYIESAPVKKAKVGKSDDRKKKRKEKDLPVFRSRRSLHKTLKVVAAKLSCKRY